jgi:hypothetical protein
MNKLYSPNNNKELYPLQLHSSDCCCENVIVFSLVPGRFYAPIFELVNDTYKALRCENIHTHSFNISLSFLLMIQGLSSTLGHNSYSIKMSFHCFMICICGWIIR